MFKVAENKTNLQNSPRATFNAKAYQAAQERRLSQFKQNHQKNTIRSKIEKYLNDPEYHVEISKDKKTYTLYSVLKDKTILKNPSLGKIEILNENVANFQLGQQKEKVQIKEFESQKFEILDQILQKRSKDIRLAQIRKNPCFQIFANLEKEGVVQIHPSKINDPADFSVGPKAPNSFKIADIKIDEKNQTISTFYTKIGRLWTKDQSLQNLITPFRKIKELLTLKENIKETVQRSLNGPKEIERDYKIFKEKSEDIKKEKSQSKKIEMTKKLLAQAHTLKTHVKEGRLKIPIQEAAKLTAMSQLFEKINKITQSPTKKQEGIQR